MSVAEMTSIAQYLTFTLAEETFALEISRVKEVLEYTSITRVPRTPDFMLGVINLRGNVVPVVDMRVKFGIPQVEKTVNTCIIITEVSIAGETTALGVLVDSVQEVLDIEEDKMEPPPRIGMGFNTDFIRAMGRRDSGFVIILDTDRIFSADELAVVAASQN
ncbi:MAG: purine-binding chemotaxis protein CheW [Nitrospirae bacterium]|nr:purine-binding chemotaxis protein CheW [Nitrospirota bacterium]